MRIADSHISELEKFYLGVELTQLLLAYCTDIADEIKSSNWDMEQYEHIIASERKLTASQEIFCILYNQILSLWTVGIVNKMWYTIL